MATFTRDSLFNCAGLVAVVTGGGTGLGLVAARSLEENGAKVYIIGRRKEKLEIAAQTAKNGNIIPLQGDVTSKPSLQSVADHIAAETGYVNLLIANSGIVGPTNTALAPRPDGTLASVQEVQRMLWERPMENITDVYNTNVTSALYTTIAFLDLLDKGNKQENVRQLSQVLVTTSIGGFHRSWPSTGLAYTTSKAAVNHLTKSLASFLIQYRIRVNGIAPGIFPSEMSSSVLGDTNERRNEGDVPKALVPLGRMGHQEEMAGTFLYFASEAGAYCSGTIHVIDGGRLGVLPGSTY